MARNLFIRLQTAVNNFRKNYLRRSISLEPEFEVAAATFARALISPVTNKVVGYVDQKDAFVGRVSPSFNAALLNDRDYEGEVIEGFLPQSEFDQNAFFRAVGIATSNGINYSDPTNNLPAIGLLVRGVNVGLIYVEPIVLVRGVARFNDWNWTPGADIYLDANSDSGDLTAAPDTASSGYIVQKVGRAITTDIAYFDFGLEYTVNP